MEEKIYKVSLANGTEITNLKLNGNNFVSNIPINESAFTGGLSEVIINDGTTDEVHNNMELVQITQMGDEYWFILRDIPETERAFAKLQSDMEYIAMMASIEI